MKPKTRFLEDQRESLLRRSAAQRDDLALQFGYVDGSLRRIDNGLVAAGRWLSSPLVIVVALTIVLITGRGRFRSLKTVGAGMGLLTSALRARRQMARQTARGD